MDICLHHILNVIFRKQNTDEFHNNTMKVEKMKLQQNCFTERLKMKVMFR